MTLPEKEDYIFYQGEKFQVEFYFTKTGKIPAKEYLEKESLDVQVKLAALVKYIADHGRLLIQQNLGKWTQEIIYLSLNPWIIASLASSIKVER